MRCITLNPKPQNPKSQNPTETPSIHPGTVDGSYKKTTTYLGRRFSIILTKAPKWIGFRVQGLEF